MTMTMTTVRGTVTVTAIAAIEPSPSSKPLHPRLPHSDRFGTILRYRTRLVLFQSPPAGG